MRGDLILFRAQRGSLVDWAISFATHGPYTHVGISLGDARMLEATEKGVEINPVPLRPAATIHPAKGADIERGLTEVLRFKGDRYGWLDIFSQFLKFCGLNLNMGQSKTLDCAHLAALYCLASGALDLGDLEPQMVNPNDLARAAHLI